jgi:hypothetical protein
MTVATAGEVSVDLPSGLPWLRVGARVYDYDQFIHNDITDLDLDVGEGIAMCHNRAMAVTGDYLPSHCGLESPIFFMDESASPVVTSCDANYGPSFELVWPAVTTEETITSQAIGALPFSGLVLGDFAREPFVIADYGDAKLVYTQGAYAVLLESFVQEVVANVL